MKHGLLVSLILSCLFAEANAANKSGGNRTTTELKMNSAQVWKGMRFNKKQGSDLTINSESISKLNVNTSDSKNWKVSFSSRELEPAVGVKYLTCTESYGTYEVIPEQSTSLVDLTSNTFQRRLSRPDATKANCLVGSMNVEDDFFSSPEPGAALASGSSGMTRSEILEVKTISGESKQVNDFIPAICQDQLTCARVYKTRKEVETKHSNNHTAFPTKILNTITVIERVDSIQDGIVLKTTTCNLLPSNNSSVFNWPDPIEVSKGNCLNGTVENQGRIPFVVYQLYRPQRGIVCELSIIESSNTAYYDHSYLKGSSGTDCLMNYVK